MTVRAKNRALIIASVIAIAVVAAALLPMVASSELDQTRPVHLVVRDMAFYLDGKGEPNPTLTVRPGERLRLILTNEDAGMDHDFSVSKWNVGTKIIHGRGQDAVTIKVPKKRGSETYFCSPHAGKMRGMIRIE